MEERPDRLSRVMSVPRTGHVETAWLWRGVARPSPSSLCQVKTGLEHDRPLTEFSTTALSSSAALVIGVLL